MTWLVSSELVQGLASLGPLQVGLGTSLAGGVGLCRNLQVSVKQLDQIYA